MESLNLINLYFLKRTNHRLVFVRTQDFVTIRWSNAAGEGVFLDIGIARDLAHLLLSAKEVTRKYKWNL